VHITSQGYLGNRLDCFMDEGRFHLSRYCK
jgi:hypothetical protein